MIAIIITGTVCLLGLLSLINSIRRAPTLDVDEDHFIIEEES